MGRLRTGNGRAYSGFCSWRALKTKDKTYAMETGRAWLSWTISVRDPAPGAEKGAVVGDGETRSSQLSSACASGQKLSHSYSLCQAILRAASASSGRLLGDRKLNLGLGQPAAEAASSPHPFLRMCFFFPPDLVSHCGSSNKTVLCSCCVQSLFI